MPTWGADFEHDDDIVFTYSFSIQHVGQWQRMKRKGRSTRRGAAKKAKLLELSPGAIRKLERAAARLDLPQCRIVDALIETYAEKLTITFE